MEFDYIQSYHELAHNCIEGPLGRVFQTLVFLLVTIVNISIFTANITNVAHFFNETTGFPIWAVKVSALLGFLVV